MHTWSLPRWVLESALPPPPPRRLSRSRMQPLPLICIYPKPCSTKGDKLQATCNQTAKVLRTSTGRLLVWGERHLIRSAAKVDSTCLGFLLKFTRQGGDRSCRRRNPFKIYVRWMLTPKSRKREINSFGKKTFCLRGSRRGSRAPNPFSGEFHKCHQSLPQPRGRDVFPAWIVTPTHPGES